MPAATLDRAISSITHRGPDQQGKYRSAAVSLGAVRLKVIDLTGGEQPIKADGSVIVFNGEIYNHIEVRKELEQLGHKFDSHCDTEVVLKAFLQWDIDAFARLRGMFAAAIWNELEHRLVLCRDRAGMKPLYYFRNGEDLYFASELKGILAHREVPRNIDLEGLGHYLSLNYVPAPHTLIRGIQKLRPGHWLEWKNGKLRHGAYWTMKFSERDISFQDAKSELDSLLRESVREHLVADVPVGLWASGGIDSSTLLHYSSEQFAGKLKTFSVTFPGRSFDESQYIRTIAHHYGTDHHEVELNPDLDLASAIEDISYYSDEPSADAGAVPVWFLSRLATKHVTVSLSGEGADELFGGYQTYLADAYSSRFRIFPKTLRRMIAAAAKMWPASDEKISLGYKLQRFTEGSLLSRDAAHNFWNGTFSQRDKARLAPEAARTSVDDLYHAIHAPSGLTRYLEYDCRYYLPDDILYKTDRMSMAHSLEVRIPFLDHRVMEFAASLPNKYKVNGSKLKFVLKQLMKDKLPPVILSRPKQGLDIPTHDWFRTCLRPLLLDTLNERALRQTGIFNVEETTRLIDAHLDRRIDVGYHLWGLTTMMLWAKRWEVEFGSIADTLEIRKGAAVEN